MVIRSKHSAKSSKTSYFGLFTFYPTPIQKDCLISLPNYPWDQASCHPALGICFFICQNLTRVDLQGEESHLLGIFLFHLISVTSWNVSGVSPRLSCVLLLTLLLRRSFPQVQTPCPGYRLSFELSINRWVEMLTKWLHKWVWLWEEFWYKDNVSINKTEFMVCSPSP